MRAMVLKEFRQLRRDRRTVAMLIALPLLLLVVFGFAANFTVSTLRVAIEGPQAAAVEQLMSSNPQAVDKFDVVKADTSGSDADARTELRDDRADLAIVTPGADGAASAAKPMVYIDGSNIFAAQSARIVVANLGDKVDSQVLFNPDLKTSWVMVPALIGLILTFVGTLITSIGMVREREVGTLEQLAVMPLRPATVILGKITPYFVLACFDMVVITLLGMWIFGVPFNGSPFPFIAAAALFLFVVLGMGVLISTASQTTGQAVQAALMTVVPQILLSGIIFPLDAMAAGVRWIGYFLPLTWFNEVSQGVMLRGASWGALWLPLAILALLAVVIFGAAVLRLSRELAPAGHGRKHADPVPTGGAR